MSNNKTEWKRISAEGAAIVTSILLAFWIDAWWNSRQDREDQLAAMSALLVEFQQIRTNVDDIQTFQAAIMDSSKQLLQHSADPASIVSDIELDRLLADQTWVSSPENFLTPELDSVISRGDLKLIQNRELREILRSWPAKLTWIRLALAADLEFTTTVMEPYYREKLSLLQLSSTGMHRPGDPSYSVESSIDKPKEIVSHAAILSERVFQNILWQRHDILLDVISLARDPELPQRLDETIELLQKGLD